MAERENGGFIKSSLFSGLEKLRPPSVFIEIKGNNEATIEGCKGILEYDSVIIRISVGSYAVAVKGKGLTIKCMSAGSVVISGVITSLEYES